MTITADNQILASDFINESEKNGTPSNDAGRVPKFESDGKIHPFFSKNGVNLDCGETINGATTPVPVYQNKTDNELYACDANDTNKLKFIGFVISNGTDGNVASFQGSGIVGGFSSLQEGEKYYVQDTAGTIGTSPGTYEILVGVAISTTEILIMKGTRRASGVTSFNSTSTTTITTGFRPSRVTIHAVGDGDIGGQSHSHGSWDVYGNNKCVLADSDTGGSGTGSDSSYSWNIGRQGSGIAHRGVVDTITDTGFRLNNTQVGGSVTIYVYWEAEGEL